MYCKQPLQVRLEHGTTACRILSRLPLHSVPLTLLSPRTRACSTPWRVCAPCSSCWGGPWWLLALDDAVSSLLPLLGLLAGTAEGAETCSDTEQGS